MITPNPIVLLVDDSDNDGRLMRIIFERAGFTQPLCCVGDGVEAIDYLRGDGIYADRAKFPLPTVMLLDLNMPRKDGFEVLGWIRLQPELKRLRVYILSSSSRPEDIRRCYDLGANAYLIKPSNLDGLTELAKTLGAWLKLTHGAPLTPAMEGRLIMGPPRASALAAPVLIPALIGEEGRPNIRGRQS